jgi:2-keto-4-pentenoate hydratase
MDAAHVSHAAQALLRARREGVPVPAQDVLPADLAAAYAVQDATVAALGGVVGWKVGAPSTAVLPQCAPLPAGALHACGCVLRGASWRLRGIEVEVALRLGRDLVVESTPSVRDLQAAVEAVLPAMEVVETRLADWRGSPPLAQVADLQTHGALVLGEAAAVAPQAVDLRQLLAYLAFDGQPVASTRGAHPHGDLWALLGWLAVHCTQRGQPLRAGQVVTTGSCSGLLFAPAGAQVEAHLDGLGRVRLQF